MKQCLSCLMYYFKQFQSVNTGLLFVRSTLATLSGNWRVSSVGTIELPVYSWINDRWFLATLWHSKSLKKLWNIAANKFWFLKSFSIWARKQIWRGSEFCFLDQLKQKVFLDFIRSILLPWQIFRYLCAKEIILENNVSATKFPCFQRPYTCPGRFNIKVLTLK